MRSRFSREVNEHVQINEEQQQDHAYLGANGENTGEILGYAVYDLVANVPPLVGLKYATNHHEGERILAICSKKKMESTK